MKRIRALVLLAVSGAAMADGKPSQYDQAIINQMSLDPNEAVVNDDGAVENPASKMTPTARAFRNGIINGRRMQQESADVPPLPPTMAEDSHGWTPPPAPRVAPQAPPRQYRVQQYPNAQYGRRPAVVAQAGGAYASVDDDDGPVAYVNSNDVSQFPPNRAGITNVYVQQAPQYRQPQQYQQYQPYPYAEEPEPVYVPPPQAVYVPPPPGAIVYAPGVPPTLATGYWPRGYQPRYARPVYAPPQPYVSFGVQWR